MKIAIPTSEGKLCMHFGHCEQFAILDVNKETKEIIREEYITPPPHEPGLLPRWLAEKGANCIIAGGMGSRAQNLFKENKIDVITGSSVNTPAEIVTAFLNDSLVTGTNTCDH
ncbi:MAG: ATPase [bacterium]|nr:ATPase [bacterium]